MAGTDLIANIASRVAEQQGLRLVAGSNITPEVTVYDSADLSPSLLDALGIRTYARLEDKNGNVIASYGQTEPINWLYALAYWGLVGASLIAIARGILK